MRCRHCRQENTPRARFCEQCGTSLALTCTACGGEVLVSSLVKELTQSAGDIRFDEGREAALNGLSGTYTLHPVNWLVESSNH